MLLVVQFRSFYKMYNNISPLYLSSLVPPLVQNTSNYSLRNADDIRTIHARTSLYSNSFLPSTIRDWNNLPSADRNADSVDTFKRHLSHGRVSVPKYFYTGNRRMQILHTRLRTGSSSLKYDLYSKNITLHCVTADVVPLKIQSISSLSVTYIGTTDWFCTTL